MWVLALAVSILSAALCLRYFARRGERLYVLVVVGTSWSIGFFMFLVLPFDLEHAYCRRCRYTSAHAAAPRGNETANDVIAWEDQPSDCHCLPHPGIEALPTLIPAAYRVTMLLGYLMNDLLRSYISSGEFTSRGRLRDALRECAFFYVPFTVVGVGFLVYLISRQGLTLTAVRMLVTGLFNAIGLFILVAFLGYGLVEVPRQLWHRADGIGQLRFLRFKVAVLSEELHEASRKLEEVIEAVHATDAALRAEAASASAQASLRLQAGMARILRRCPPPQSRLAEPGGGLRPVPEPGGGAAGGAGRSRTHSRSNSLTSFIAGSSVCSATA
ncbi:hypothetical protein EMIHUDRAFT_455026, partial [Emiliania huxleyi CCMP1516]|uniref:Uncharacterized protein n=2 Tax=Emiliania huxleyi TaxID=2903 RepID=A0A0D3KLN2_EMIH1